MKVKKKVRNEKRQFQRYWPPGCIYVSWPNYWAYQDLNPWHGWTVAGRTVRAGNPQLLHDETIGLEELGRKKSLERVAS